MKKIYFLFSALISGISLQAQLTQANHAPVAGDTYQAWQCDSVAPGAAGSGIVWNFASLGTHSNIVITYSASATTNPGYPMATVSLSYNPNGMLYYSSNTSSLSYYGGNVSVGSGAQAVIGALTYTSPAVYASTL